VAIVKKSAFFYAVFLLLVTEFSLQGFYFFTAGAPLWKRTAIPIYQAHPYAVFFNKPNLRLRHVTNEYKITLFTNAQGLRVSSPGETFPYQKDPATYRILLLGPSFAFGWGVDYEQSFGPQLQKYLNENHFKEKKVEVISAGVPALDVPNQLAWYQHEGYRYAPDLVIQMIYEDFEFNPGIQKEYSVDSRGYLIRQTSVEEKMLAYAKNSATVFYTWIICCELQKRFSKNPARQMLGAGREMELEGKTFQEEDSRVQAVMKQYYFALKETVENSGAKLLVMYFPFSYVIYQEDAFRWQHRGVTNIEAQMTYNKLFCDYLSRQGLDCLNLTESLVSAAQKTQERLYYWLDIHWTSLGNEISAKTVGDYLIKEAESAA